MNANQIPMPLDGSRCRPGLSAWLALLSTLWIGPPALCADEPQYAGKLLSYWLHQLDETRKFNWYSGEFDISPEAARPIREIGEAAVPFLISHLREGIAAGHEYDRTAHGLAEEERRKLDDKIIPGREAVLGFAALGERGSGAVPALTELMWQEQDFDGNWMILDSLAHIGASAVPAFRLALTSTNRSLRCDAALAARMLGEQGAPLVSLLIGLVTNSDSVSFERDFSATSLGMIGRPPEVIMSLLSGLLSSSDDDLRGNACLGLMFMGNKAEPAIRKIEVHLKNQAGELDGVMLMAMVVLCSDDKRIIAALERDFQVVAGPNGIGNSQGPSDFREIFSVVRQSWLHPNDTDAREKRLAVLAKIQPLKKPE